MRYAIFSDIHNNAAALTAVILHAQQNQVDGYFCLGDVGIDSCVHLVREVAAPTVFGNWEVGNWRGLSRLNQQWVLTLAPTLEQNDFWLTHAAPLWPSDIRTLTDFNTQRHRLSMATCFPYLHMDSDALWASFAKLTEAKIPLMFHGHTHCQITWRFHPDNRLEKSLSRNITLQPDETFIIGVGSVGSPNDAPGAAYVIYDEAAQQVEMIRVR